MKYGWMVLLLLAASVAPRAAKAQASVYGEFSESVMTNLVTTKELPGVTAGVLLDGPHFAHKITLAADVQGRFLNTSSMKMNGVSVGPRFTFALRHGISPYAEVLIGFARYYSDGTVGTSAGSTTDSELQFNGGLGKKISSHLDVVGEFSYAQYYALGGAYNPKTASIGVIYHFAKR